MTLGTLARTIAMARYGTDVNWAAMLPAARAVIEAIDKDIQPCIAAALGLREYVVGEHGPDECVVAQFDNALDRYRAILVQSDDSQ